MDPGLPWLCLVTDRNRCNGRSLLDVVDRAVSGGVNLVQLRERDLPASQLYHLGVELRKITQGRAILLVNDRVDVAIACGADGVQLGEKGLPSEIAKELSKGKLLLSRSVHSLDSAEKALDGGVDLLVLGTIFPSGSHPNGETGGLDRIINVTAIADVPVLAIGGITAGNVGSVIEAGASGAAVITAITQSPNPKDSALALASQMQEAWASVTSSGVARRI